MKRPQNMANDAESSLTPKLRFPEFREAPGWEVSPLSKFVQSLDAGVSVNSGDAPATKEQRGILKTSAVTNGVFEPNENKVVLSEEEQARLCEPVTANTIIISRMNTPALVGANAYVASGMDNLFLPDRLWAAKPRPNASMPFLAFVLGSDKGRAALATLATGTSGSMKNITKPDVLNLPIVAPALAEQQKIAECLSTLDELIGAEGQKLDALKAHRKGLMQQLFPREGETLPRLRFPEFQNAGEWAKMSLGQAATFYNGRAYKQEELLESGKYPVLRVGNFFTSNTWYYSDLELDETKYCQKGDLLYAWSASFGPRIWRGERSIYHYHIWKVIEQRGIDKQFLFITLENETENMKAKTTNGLGIMHITKGAIEGWESAFPTLAEQRKIAGCLTSIDNIIASEIKKLNALKIHKDGLMQQLFPSPVATQS